MIDLNEFFARNGVSADAYVLLDRPVSPANIRYGDLLHCNSKVGTMLPDAVIESSGFPIIYVIRTDHLGGESTTTALPDLLRTLGCRADARFLAVVSPGVVSIYPVGIQHGMPDAVTSFPNDSGYQFREFLSGGNWGDIDTKKTNPNQVWLDHFLLRLLNASASALRDTVSKEMLDNEAVISLIGRALFLRFLADREIVTDADARGIATGALSVEDLYSTPEKAAATFQWLDTTFNGDLLHLTNEKDYTAFFDRLGNLAGDVCKVLTDIQYRAVNGQLELGWRGLRFKHIPVDVLSQVYESFSHKYLPEKSASDSIHYTPRHLAELLVDGAFSALPENERQYAKILDPAVGAGVFLVLALRRLVKERWIATGYQPTRPEIREILNSQLRGFDINSGALKVAALSLYLSAIEMDPDPQPLSELKFAKLFGSVLHDTGRGEEGLGSLSNDLDKNLPSALVMNAEFDIVIGNPPWTSLKGAPGKALDDIVRSIAKEKLLDIPKDTLVRYQVPDQPFVWRAMQWAKKGGAIAFLLDGALLFQPESFAMRSLIFKAIRITGILNGAALRQTNVWPSIGAQFCLLVGRNEAPDPSDAFFYISPKRERVLNDKGLCRIDPQAAIPVPLELVHAEPQLFKILFKGSALDLELIRKLRGVPFLSLGTYLEKMGLEILVGYIKGKQINRTRDASFLLGLKAFSGKDAGKFIVETESLEDWCFDPPKLQWPRCRDNYSAPLLLFRKASKLDVASRGALISYKDVAFSESFYGLSLAKSEEGKEIAEYLFVLSYSSLFLYCPLMLSSKLGVERETYHKEDYENCPIVPWETLSDAQRNRAKELCLAIIDGSGPWVEVDEFVLDVYSLSPAESNLISDAVQFEQTHSRSQGYATSCPNESEINCYLENLKRILNPFFKCDYPEFSIESLKEYGGKSWAFFSISLKNSKVGRFTCDLAEISASVTEPFWSSQVRINIDSGSIIVGQLAQRRYWTASRARLLALEILEQGSGFFAGDYE
jgi:hypothetical protein